MEAFVITMSAILIIVLATLAIVFNKNTSKEDVTIIYVFIILLTAILITTIDEKCFNNKVVKILNSEIQYDTIALDKNGKLLEIKLK